MGHEQERACVVTRSYFARSGKSLMVWESA